MRKLTLIMGTVAVLAMLGAGCADEPGAETPAANTPANAPVNTPVNAPTAENSNANVPLNVVLKDLPAVKSFSDPYDDSSWVTTTTKTGVALKVPIKGAFAPTWTYALLDNNDPHLQGGCYVTADTVYKRTKFTGYADGTVCQTTTEINPGPGERTDYFVFHDGGMNSKGVQETRTHLFTFTKKYSAGFDMDTYGATIERVVNIID